MLTVVCLLLLIGQGGAQHTHSKRGSEVVNDTAMELSTLSCPGLWSIYENTSGSVGCRCGSSLGGMVQCNGNSSEVQLLPCFCMSPYARDPNIIVAGACMYTCRHIGTGYDLIPSDVHDLSDYMCGTGDFRSNREGQLCGKCKEGFAPPVYSHDWRCVRCSSNNNVAKYCVVAFLPLTIFFVMVITFHISATSPSMNAFLLVCQVLTFPVQARILSSDIFSDGWTVIVAVIGSVYGFWNLDFFRTLYPRFCLHPGMSTLQVLALDYIIAAYPLFLTGITYSLVKLHNHDCKLVVWLWKPFRICFARLQRQWDIQTSLVEAFASFLLLSYVKFLSVSFDFLVPVCVYNVHGESMELYLYFDGTVEYFGKQHLPYAILAIVVLLIFNILPLILLFLYPCSSFQKILNFYNLDCHALHIFMDAFQGCYKNGTDNSRDCRYFSTLYLLVRILILLVFAMTLSSSVIMACFIAGVILTSFAFLFAVVQPYKLPKHNTVDTGLILTVALVYFCLVASAILGVQVANTKSEILLNIMFAVLLPVPFIYMTVVAVYWIISRHTKIAALVLKIRLLCESTWRRNNSVESLLPDRCTNPEECAALLQDPMNIEQSGDDELDEPSIY